MEAVQRPTMRFVALKLAIGDAVRHEDHNGPGTSRITSRCALDLEGASKSMFRPD